MEKQLICRNPFCDSRYKSTFHNPLTEIYLFIALYCNVIIEDKEQYNFEISNRFPALEILDAELNINTAYDTVRENIKISAVQRPGYYELKKHKPWFDEGGSELLDGKKQAKLHGYMIHAN